MRTQSRAVGVGSGTTDVCALDDIDVEGGVVALVAGRAVAIFRTHDGELYALDNYDPIGRASVLARGLVGTRCVEGHDVPFVASPLHKQAYDLRTGRCLDDAAVRVPTFTVTVGAGGRVLVGAEEKNESQS